MQLTLTYIGTATEGRVALLMSMRRHGYPVRSPVTLATMVPIIPSKMQAPLYIRAGAVIPDPDVGHPGSYNYIVPAGGLRLDMCEYTDIVGSINLLRASILPDWRDLLEEILSLEVMCYYRPVGVPPSSVAQVIGSITDAPRFGNLLFPPVDGFAFSEQGFGPIAECDGVEGFCCISKYAWLLNYLPRPVSNMYHPFLYDGGFWLPVDAPIYRYNLWDKPYSGVFGSYTLRYDWIVAHDDKYRNPSTGEIFDMSWSGALYQSHGYLASLTSASGRDLMFGGYRYNIEGAVGTWLSTSAYIHECITVTGAAVGNLPIVAAPPTDLHQYPVKRVSVFWPREMLANLRGLGKLSKSVVGGVFLKDETGAIIRDENEEGVTQ